ncbi:MAG: rhodanese-like domain-containing protein [Gammaproteobacteria bacterium]|nr:rhodanese-like domain-containing protein [Gammaproteobacteria bacterium]
MNTPQAKCQETKRLLQRGARLVDVRSEHEFSAGALQGAINHPVQWLSSGQHLDDKDTPIVVYCATGARSQAAKQMLQMAGFKEVHDLGGFQNIQYC